MQSSLINSFIAEIDKKNLKPSINLDRPIYVQPEDRMSYRSCRVLLILGMLNTKNGLSKEVIACMDFLLRNAAYRKKFIIEYFKEQKNLLNKMNEYNPGDNYEIDFNIVQYKSVPWDLRFNDIFLFLYVRDFVNFTGKKPNLRVHLNEKSADTITALKEVFIDEVNFLEIFGSRLVEERTIDIITNVIPNSYWIENEKFNY